MVLGYSLPCAFTWIGGDISFQTLGWVKVCIDLARAGVAILIPEEHRGDHIENSGCLGRHFKNEAGEEVVYGET